MFSMIILSINNPKILKSAIESLRRAMKTLNFGLDDPFCDPENLERSSTQCFLTSEG